MEFGFPQAALDVLRRIKLLLLTALAHLGLSKTHQEQEQPVALPNSILIMDDGPSPSLVPVPIHIIKDTIKNRVPVVEYGMFLRGRRGHDPEGEHGAGEEMVCAVCLSCIDRRHEVRELSNCWHVFHRECLDGWVDANQVTCPLCRSLLFPVKRHGGRAQRLPLWQV